MEFKPLIDYQKNNEWVQLIGKYMLNMGAIEAATRVIIGKLHSSDQVPIFKSELDARVRYLRGKFPFDDKERHEKAMLFFDALLKHVKFRNIIAHSGVTYVDGPDEDKIVNGLLNFLPNDSNSIAEYISLEELKGRVNESARLGATLLDYQSLFTLDKFGSK